MDDAEVLAAIQANHLKANIGGYEKRGATIHWDRAYLDSLGPGSLYAHVPITVTEYGFRPYEIVARVYPPERLKQRLLKHWVMPEHLKDALARLFAKQGA